MTSILVVVFIVGLLYLAVFVEHFRDVLGITVARAVHRLWR